MCLGAVAQLGERRPCKAEAVGSTPISSMIVGSFRSARGSGARKRGELGLLDFCELFFDNCIRATVETESALDHIGQATKGARWMPWRKQAMKDVASCDKLRGAAKQALIRRSPNGETRCR